jgi:putative tricarboxylic transport membrane protein
MNMAESKQNLIIGLIVIIGGGLLFWDTFYFPAPIKANAPGPDFFPRIILIILFILGITLLASNLFIKSKREVPSKSLFDYKKFLVTVGLIVLYLFLLPHLGFLLASFLYISSNLIHRLEGRIKVVTLAAVSSACLYFIFAWLLNVRLPHLFLP